MTKGSLFYQAFGPATVAMLAKGAAAIAGSASSPPGQIARRGTSAALCITSTNTRFRLPRAS